MWNVLVHCERARCTADLIVLCTANRPHWTVHLLQWRYKCNIVTLHSVCCLVRCSYYWCIEFQCQGFLVQRFCEVFWCSFLVQRGCEVFWCSCGAVPVPLVGNLIAWLPHDSQCTRWCTKRQLGASLTNCQILKQGILAAPRKKILTFLTRVLRIALHFALLFQCA